MNFYQLIEKTFDYSLMPTKLVELKNSITSEQQDAFWFNGRDWRSITWEDWENHRDAIYSFTAEAFVYYLPSILILSVQHPEKWFYPADVLLNILDRSPIVEYWDEFLTERLVGLKETEYEIVKEWLLLLSGHDDSNTEDVLSRAYETVDLLQKYSSKNKF